MIDPETIPEPFPPGWGFRPLNPPDLQTPSLAESASGSRRKKRCKPAIDFGLVRSRLWMARGKP